MRNFLTGLLFLIGIFGIPLSASAGNDELTEDVFTVEFPEIVVQGISHDISIISDDKRLKKARIILNGKPREVQFTNGKAFIPIELEEEKTIRISAGGTDYSKTLNPIPLWQHSVALHQ